MIPQTDADREGAISGTRGRVRSPNEKSARWLNRFIWFTALATLFLICSGGMVTSKGVGLAVPDWPTTFGYNMFLFPVSKWIGGVLFEHTHRLIASTVGLLTIILAVWLWRTENRPAVKTLGLIAVAGVVLQGILGGLRVTMLKDQIGIFHACLAQAFLGLIMLIAIVTTDFWRTLNRNSTVLNGQVHQRFRRVKQFAIVATTLIYVQLALGATMRHQHKDLAILDFPTANGAWIPDTSAPALAKINAWRDARALSNVDAFQIWLQMAHRFLAVLIGIAVIVFALRVWRLRKSSRAPILSGLSILWVVLFFLQFTLGASTIWSNKAADVATAHVAVGAIMLSFGVSAWAICWRVLQTRNL
ncbi:MAG: COX15/CtaA family protein [Verrucomicrobiota bacterium]|nr:COX15/CtaA family protein [Verrucomicrobiota bacterium]